MRGERVACLRRSAAGRGEGVKMVPARKLKIKLGEILLQISSLGLEQLKEALTFQLRQLSSPLLGDVLLEKGYIQKEDLEAALAVQQGYPYLPVANYKIEPQLLRKIPLELMQKFNFLPLDIIGNTLTVAISSLVYQSEILKELKDYKVRFFISRQTQIREALRDYYG